MDEHGKAYAVAAGVLAPVLVVIALPLLLLGRARNRALSVRYLASGAARLASYRRVLDHDGLHVRAC